MATKAITRDSFVADILDSDRPVLLDFWAPWCAPCKQIGPILEELSEELGDRLSICKMDVDQNPDAPALFGIRSIPTMILFKEGVPAATLSGAASKTDIVAWIDEWLAPQPQ